MSRTIVICDDEKDEAVHAAEILEEHLRSLNEKAKVLIYSSGEELLGEMKSGRLLVDIVFMDIELKAQSGIRVAEEINQLCPSCYIVYLTNHLEYAVDVYGSEHLYYILKQEFGERLPKLWDKIMKIEMQEEKKLSISLKNSGTMVVPGDDIIYAEQKGRVTEVYLMNQMVETMEKLAELEQNWGEEQFVQCHNSYLINLKRIAVYKREIAEMKNGFRIPISRKYQKIVKEKFLAWSKTQLF